MKKIIFAFVLAFGLCLGAGQFQVPVLAHEEDEEPVYPEVLCDAVLVGDCDEDRILYMETEDEEALISPASTTKVMTALLIVEAVERGDLKLDQVVVVGKEIESVNYKSDSNANLIPDEELCINDLLGVLLVQSACEAANVLAVAHSGSEREFVHQMNTRANELGMVSTVYRNAHGLYDAEHVTTLTDLYLLMREAARHDLLMSYLSAERWDVAKTNKSKSRSYMNHARILDSENVNYCSYVVGGKSGYLSQKASALVLLGELPDPLGPNGVHRVVLVLHNTEDLSSSQAFARLYFDTKSLLEWTASHFSTKVLVSSEEALGTLAVSNSVTEKLSYYVTESFSYYLPDAYDERAFVRLIMTDPLLKAPVEAGQNVGTYILKYNDRIIYRGTLMVREGAEQLVPEPLLNIWQGALAGLLFVALLGAGAFLILKKKK